MKLQLELAKETKNCYRFALKDTSDTLSSMYIRKEKILAAGINPRKGIVVTVEEAPGK